MITVAAHLTAAEAARLALAAHSGGPALAVALLTGGRNAGARMIVSADGSVTGTLGSADIDRHARNIALDALQTGKVITTDVQYDDVACTILIEPHFAPDQLVIVGAGHIAVPLAQFADALGFAVSVLDDREEFAEAERFPRSARVLRVDFSAPFNDVRLDARTSVVLVTRAHKYDFDCLRTLLKEDQQVRYIGMVGSRRRVRAALHGLLEHGIPRHRLAGVRTPVGLDIGAETPAEIAVSIVAEIVLARRGGSGAPLFTQERVLERLLKAEAGDS